MGKWISSLDDAILVFIFFAVKIDCLKIWRWWKEELENFDKWGVKKWLLINPFLHGIQPTIERKFGHYFIAVILTSFYSLDSIRICRDRTICIYIHFVRSCNLKEMTIKNLKLNDPKTPKRQMLKPQKGHKKHEVFVVGTVDKIKRNHLVASVETTDFFQDT